MKVEKSGHPERATHVCQLNFHSLKISESIAAVTVLYSQQRGTIAVLLE